MIEVELPDGRILQIQTDDQNQAVSAAKSFMDRESAQQRVAQEKRDHPTMTAIDDRVRAAARGLPLIGPGMDELSAGLNTGFGYLGDYGKEVAYQRERDGVYDSEHPLESFSVKLGAGLAGGGAAYKALKGTGALRVPTSLSGKFAAGTATGAALGAGEAFLNAEGGIDSRSKPMPQSALIGGALGGAVPVAGAGIGSLMGRLKPRKFPTTEQLNEAKHAAYEAAASTGEMLPRKTVAQMGKTINRNLREDFFSPHIAPKTAHAINILSSGLAKQGFPTSKHVAPMEIEAIRKILVRATKTSDGEEGFRAGQAIGFLDDAMDSTMTSPKLAEARRLARQAAKAEALDRARYTAENAAGANTTAGGIEAALRQKYRGIADNKNFSKRYTPEEQRAILDVIKGSVGGNVARMAPGAGKLGTALHMALAFINPALGGTTSALSVGARAFSNSETARRAAIAEALVKGGPKSLLPPEMKRNAERAVNLLLLPQTGKTAEALRSQFSEPRSLPGRR